jgi:HSP20 family molecular chaperone IbpA
VGTLSDEIQQMFDSVARRAFEIFQSNGQVFGHDVENWLQAEGKLFHPAHLDVSESAEGFTVRAEVPGFAAQELEVNIDGQRLTISGKRAKSERIRSLFIPNIARARFFALWTCRQVSRRTPRRRV